MPVPTPSVATLYYPMVDNYIVIGVFDPPNMSDWKKVYFYRSESPGGNYVEIGNIDFGYGGGAHRFADTNVVKGTTYYYKARGKKGSDYSDYSSYTYSLIPQDRVIIRPVFEDVFSGAEGNWSRVTRYNAPIADGVDTWKKKEIDANFSYCDAGSLRLKVEPTSAQSDVYLGVRRVLSARNDKILDLEGFFCMEYYSGDPNENNNLHKIDYYFFEVYIKKQAGIYWTRLMVNYFGKKPDGTDIPHIRYLKSDGTWGDVDSVQNPYKIETFSHWHYFRLRVDYSAAIPKLTSLAVNDKRLTNLNENLPICSDANYPTNNDECHFVYMQYSANAAANTFARCWLTNFRQFADRGVSGDMLGQNPYCGLLLT